MAVVLRCADDLASVPRHDHWFAVTGTTVSLPADTRLPDIAARLEAAFDDIRDTWWTLSREMGRDDASAKWSHVAAAGTYGSDFGLMLAWTRLTEDCAADAAITLVVCSDPWLFRQMEALAGVRAGRRPALWPRFFRCWLRGIFARGALAVRLAYAVIALRGDRRKQAGHDASVLMVYGHPDSRPDGTDAYFGSLMLELPALHRLLHTDCRPGLAMRLGVDDRTASLHAWGGLGFAVCKLPFTCWRPTRRLKAGPAGWLIQRAAVRENGGGGPAMNRWQMHCQRRWLAERSPRVVAWPWENHAWERDLVRAAHCANAYTVGYQHAVVGRHQFNFSPHSNSDGMDSLPSIIACNGSRYREQLVKLGIPEECLVIAGAFRVGRIESGRYDPNGPVYVALSAIPLVANRMMAAIRPLAAAGQRFVVKNHPMYPFPFEETETLKQISTTIPQTDAIAAVLYSTGTPGLEGLLAGVPTFRLMPEDAVALDIMPDGGDVRVVTAENLHGALADSNANLPLAWADVMAPVDMEVWRRLLEPLVESDPEHGLEKTKRNIP